MLEFSQHEETDPSTGHETGHFGEIHERATESLPGKEVSSTEVTAKAYDETIQNTTSEYIGVIPENQRVRINIDRNLYRPTVMSPAEYCERFPECDPNVLGHYDEKGRIYLKDGSPEVLRHVTTHEAVHLTSYNELDDSGMHTRTYRSGIRESKYDETGLQYDRNYALNEGITELYAVRELQRREELSSVGAISAYPEAQKAANELQNIVGDERIQRAFFGGDSEQLKNEVNRLNYGDETAWDRYAKDVDTLEYGTDEEQIRAARWRITLQNAVMLSFKRTEALKT